MKMLKFALITIVVLVITSIVAFYVNYYHYSWTSFINPFGCSCKEIGVRYDKKVLDQTYDLEKIYEIIKSDEKYEETFYNGYLFKVARNFDNVLYGLSFSSYKTSTESYYKITISNGVQSHTKTTPNNLLRKNINQMIDEMPLNDAQKEDLKSKVTVGCRSTIQLSW
jgi:hypothetical protein